MAVKFLDLTGLQKLWKKIQTNFVAKDVDASVKKLTLKSTNGSNQVQIYSSDESSGSAVIDGHADVKGALVVDEGATFGGSVDITYGEGINFFNDDNTKSTHVYGSSDGSTIVVGDNPLATQAYVTTAIANAGHLKREKVSALPGVATAKENVIYMVPRTNAEDNNSFDEYMLIDGAWEKTGSSDVDLSGYANTAITGAEIDALA